MVLNRSVRASYRPNPRSIGRRWNSSPTPAPPSLQHDGHFVPIEAVDAPLQLVFQPLVLAAGETHLPQQVYPSPEGVNDVALVLVRAPQELREFFTPAPAVGQLGQVVVEADGARSHNLHLQRDQPLHFPLDRLDVEGV